MGGVREGGAQEVLRETAKYEGSSPPFGRLLVWKRKDWGGGTGMRLLGIGNIRKKKREKRGKMGIVW